MTTTKFLVPAMDCATAKDIIASRLRRVTGVEGVDFDLLDRIVTVRHRDGADVEIEGALKDIGMAPKRLADPAITFYTTRFHVPAMDCATEKDVISNKLQHVDGIKGIDFDLLDRTVAVKHQAGAERRIEDALREIQMSPKRLDGGAPATAETVERPSLAGASAWSRGAWLLGAAGAAALTAEILAWTAFSEDAWPVIALSLACIAACGPTTFRKAFVALRTLTLNINLLMTIAVAGAIAIGEWPEAAMVTFLFAVAELIESRSVDRARNAIRSLMALAPETARVRRGDTWSDVPAGEVRPGELVQVIPGDRVPLD